MATPGQLSLCFSCGQPLPTDLAKAPPPSVFAEPPRSFILSSSQATFKVSSGGDVLVGRDPARCAIHLVEPRVSGLHATMKVEGGALWVRDERSNNGVWINGERIATATWAQVPPNAALRFGPIQFSVQTAS
jgi:pSer/pThr/pTyr-binding forkhead associated (FHA) protein